MFWEICQYAVIGTVSRSGAWAPLPGTILIWIGLWLSGRTDVILPTTIPGAIYFFLCCAGITWLLLIAARFLYAPYHFLREARQKLRALQECAFEILFDPSDQKYVRLDQNYTIYRIGVKITGPTSILYPNVRVRSNPTAERLFREHGKDYIQIYTGGALDPDDVEYVRLFALPDFEHLHIEGPNDPLGQMGTFTLEIRGRDARNTPASFEYDPRQTPMIRRVS